MALQLHHAHPWDVSLEEAAAIQERLATCVVEAPLLRDPDTIAGVDMSVRKDRVQAAVVVLRVSDWQPIDEAVWCGPVTFPYVPGFLSFREVPAILRALEKLHVWPDLIMTDSQGRAHPRRLGLACHLGVLLDLPTIGVAKSRLVGRSRGPLPDEKGAWVPLQDRRETVGAMVRTRQGVKPVFVSVGHRITLDEAIAWTLAGALRYKLPEPTRLAHLLSRRQAS